MRASNLAWVGWTVAIVASTLAIAALFNPLRRRVQAFVDRRFYRGKYDAERILADFSATLREGTDLGKLDEGLIPALTETGRPEHASLWLRGSAQGPRETAARNGDSAGERRTKEGAAGAALGQGQQTGGGEP